MLPQQAELKSEPSNEKEYNGKRSSLHVPPKRPRAYSGLQNITRNKIVLS
jgi:hypothetical protein